MNAHVSVLTAAALLLIAHPAHAIRPFVTDDARVVGGKLAQLETWLMIDRSALEHNALAAIGPTEWLELSAGLSHGGVHSGPDRGYSITGPILQGKVLLLPARNNSWPGLAVALGALPPLGHGAFTPPGWSGFSYVALTESLLDEWILIHANIGIALGDDGVTSPNTGPAPTESTRLRTLITAGPGVQARLVAGLHAVAEVYHGDPYDPNTGFPAMQAGFRYIFNDHVQADGTCGSTLTELQTSGEPARTEQWGTLGLRLVTPELW